MRVAVAQGIDCNSQVLALEQVADNKRGKYSRGYNMKALACYKR